MRTKVLKPMALIMMFVLSLSFIEATFLPMNVQAYGDDNPIIVVSMGDSYSSGEGIEPFYGQKENDDPDGKDLSRFAKIDNDDWLAHRSMYSWPSLLKVGDEAVREHKMPYSQSNGYITSNGDSVMQWYFVAASGAVTGNFEGKYPRKTVTNVGTVMHPWYETKSKDLDPQLKVFEDNTLYGKVDYVTMSIGGNDLDFVPIVTTSLGDTISTDIVNAGVDTLNKTLTFTAIKVPYIQSPGFLGKRIKESWNKWENDWYDKEGKKQPSVKESLKKAYAQTLEFAGTQADIIVAGYPELYYRNTNTATANKEQRRIIDDFVIDMCNPVSGEIKKVIDSLNDELKNDPESMVTRDKIHYVSVIDEFKDKGMDAPGEQWIEGINFWGSEKLDESLSGVMGYSSVHPNKTGAEHYAELVNKKIEELEKIKSNSSVSGYVYNNINGTQEYDGDTWIGIPGVTITVKEDVSGEGLHSLDDKTTITDSNGHYDIKLPAGKYEIEASHPTYGTQSISNVIVYDNKITEAEWIVFNGKFSSTTLRIPGEDPIHTYNSNAEWAWTAYDHPNYDTSSGYDKHIIIDGDNIKMDGYLQAGYKDFLYVDDKNSTRRVFELDFQRDQTSRYDSEYNWHSMYGGGFLFNTSINEEENTISGYYILITESGAELFKIDNMAFDTFRNSENRGERLSTFTFDNRFDKHHIKIDVSSNSVSLYDGEALVIDNYKLVENYGNGFGPITSHIRHDCEQRSYFTFSNITMQTM